MSGAPPSPLIAASVPVVVVADPGYVGQEVVAEEIGEGFEVAVATGLEEAVAVIAGLDVPIVLAPDNLEPTRGAELLARLEAQGLDVVGLLLADEPDLARLSTASGRGVHAVVVRPLRPGALRLHVQAAARERARLLAVRARADRGDADLDELLGALRHELRGQLQGMTGLAGLLVELARDQLAAEPREWLDRIVSSGDRITRLVDDLAAHLRLGRRALEPSRVDLAALVSELRDDLDADDPELDKVVTFTGPSLRVLADRRALATALRHLLDNAVRYAKRKISVAVRPAPDGGAVVIVDDDGDGLPESVRERVFGLFERHYVDAEDRRAGSGLGLATVARVAALHGGRAWIEAAPGGGASVKVWLPEP